MSMGHSAVGKRLAVPNTRAASPSQRPKSHLHLEVVYDEEVGGMVEVGHADAEWLNGRAPMPYQRPAPRNPAPAGWSAASRVRSKLETLILPPATPSLPSPIDVRKAQNSVQKAKDKLVFCTKLENISLRGNMKVSGIWLINANDCPESTERGAEWAYAAQTIHLPYSA